MNARTKEMIAALKDMKPDCSGFSLSDIPNLDGFKFIGVDRDGNTFPCQVRRNRMGLHEAVDEHGERCFDRLVKWRHVLPAKPTAA